MIKIKDFFGLCLVTGVMIIAYLTLSANQSKYLDGVEAALESGEAMVLDASTDSVALAEFFVRKGYYSGRDAEFIAGSIARPLNKGIVPQNLGELNKRSFRVRAVDAYARTDENSIVHAMVDKSLDDLGWTGEISDIYEHEIPDSLIAKDGNTSLKVQIKSDDDSPVGGVLVRLKEHFSIDNAARDSILAYAFTDDRGYAEFKVTQGRFYSVLPVKRGYEYGASKGTRGGSAVSSSPYTFKQSVHTISPLDPGTFSSIKADTTLMVRSPRQYRDSRFLIFLVFIGSWWLLIIALALMDRKKKARADSLSLILLMTLSGVCLLAMFSIPNPLNDMPRAREMIEAIVVGVIAIGVLSRLDFISFYNGRLRLFGGYVKFDFIGQFFGWIATPFGEKIEALKIEGESSPGKVIRYYLGLLASVICLPFELIARLVVSILPKDAKWPDGLGYLLIAAFFIVLLTLFGQGPEGSDAKVNLAIGGFAFQPSELNKFLVVVFMAAFFARNAAKIQSFSEKLDKMRFRFQLRTVAFIFIAIAAILSLYLVLLSDMGPALVLLVTFILIYSVARRDFPQLLLGVATFAIMLVLPSWLGMSGMIRIVLVILWFVLWIAGGWAAKKRLYESAIFMNLVLVVFILGPTILSSLGFSEAERLASRMAVVGEGVWDNDVRGGDQVVNGLWALSTGGMTGQGLAKGSPGLIPAGHTDMILASVGEQMGWVMLLLVIVSFAILLHRSLLLARRTAHPFAFYLATGIAVITGVQFLVIAFGSIGVIPLTGVAVPFLSHGKTSLILNLAAFGIIASLSRYEPLAIQKKDISKYDGMVAVTSLSFIVAAGVLLGFLFKYQVKDRDEILVRPAFVAGIRGERIAEYNPRINVLLRKLDRGNIYDRNGLLLATSHHTLTDEEQSALVQAGLSEEVLTAEFARDQRRYYPFGDHTLFMVGDVNSGWIEYNEFSTAPRGLAVEAQMADSLSGNRHIKRDGKGKPVLRKVEADVRLNPYLKPQKTTITIAERDYSSKDFIKMLKDGPDSKAVEQWNAEQSRKRRDIYMTLDAKLQMEMNNAFSKFLGEQNKISAWKGHKEKLRVSAVVLEATTGELLASAMWPLPDGALLAAGSKEYRRNDITKPAISERDLGMTEISAPGSSGKIMTAIAAQSANPNNYYKKYFVEGVDQIEVGIEPTDSVDMDKAINKSSNCYFVSILNHQDLYPQLSDLYKTVGISVDGVKPYFFYQSEFTDRGKESFDSHMAERRTGGLRRYEKYTSMTRAQKREQVALRGKGKNALTMSVISPIAWGQEIDASPLSMARVASVVANNGQFVPTRYFLDGSSGNPVSTGDPVQIVSSKGAELIAKGMAHEARDGAVKVGINSSVVNNLHIGGKTGTPQITFYVDQKKMKRNDGWYIFFCDANGDGAPRKGGRLAIAVKVEWASGSAASKIIARDCIMEMVLKNDKIRYISY